jgi:hypothetical protein
MNNITIELCTEDRARLDRTYAALTRLVDLVTLQTNNTELDDLRDKLAAAIKQNDPAQAQKNAPETAQPETPADIQPQQEAAAAAEPTHPAEADLPWSDAPAAPAVTREQIQQKVVQLSVAANGAKKAKVREVVNLYAKNVSGIPEDKFAEVWDKLTALEKEA